jgi:hypothetical protein
MEPTLADLLAQQKTTGYSGDQMMGASAPAINPMQAALGMQAMKNIQGMAGAAPQTPMASGAGVAPRGNQVQLAQAPQVQQTIDPRIQMGLAQLLFGGK